MARVTDTVTIKDLGRNRAVRIIIDAPHPEELDIDYLAQKTWLTGRKKLKRGNISIRVEKIER